MEKLRSENLTGKLLKIKRSLSYWVVKNEVEALTRERERKKAKPGKHLKERLVSGLFKKKAKLKIIDSESESENVHVNDLCEEYSDNLEVSEEENDIDFGDLEPQIKDIHNEDFGEI